MLDAWVIEYVEAERERRRQEQEPERLWAPLPEERVPERPAENREEREPIIIPMA